MDHTFRSPNPKPITNSVDLGLSVSIEVIVVKKMII